jgi:hypothetical protein
MKFCPLKKETIKIDVSKTKEYFMFCDGVSCAWYAKETDECALKCIATRLENGTVKVLCKTSDP